MYFRQIVDRVDGALTYVLGDLFAQEAVVIDPSPRQHALARALLAERGLALRWVLCTHCHRSDDDRTALALLRVQTGAMGVVGGGDCPGATLRLDDGDAVTFGDEVVHVLGTPGHTPGSLSFLWHDRLFCGDALELGGFGPLPGPDADTGQIYDSVTQKLFTLPGETLVFPGHGYRGRTVSTIAEERLRNWRFAGRTRDAFVEVCAQHGTPGPRPKGRSRSDSADATPTPAARGRA